MRPQSVALAVLLAAAAVLAAGCGSSEAQDQAAPAPPEVTVAEVLIEDLHDWDEFTGRLEAVEAVELRPRVGGYIESVHFEEGRRVEKGALLFQIDPRPFRAEVDRLTAERERSRAQLELARTNHARAARLLAENAISREEFDSMATAEAIAVADLAATEAELELARLNLDWTRVTSPISGRLSRALITAGNLVDSSTLLTTVVSDDPIYAYFDADEQTYLKYAGQPGETGEAGHAVYLGLINEEGHPHQGRLDFVDNQVDADSGTIPGRAVFDNADGRFTPGLFARLKLVGRDSYQAALVDDRAIGTDLGHKFVLVVDADNIAQYRAVETGRQVAGMRVITRGLEAGDVIVINGLQRVRPGMPVAPTRVAMNGGERPELSQVAVRSPSAIVARNSGQASGGSSDIR